MTPPVPVTIKRTMPPGVWFECAGIWFLIQRLDDPLLVAEMLEVVVHREPDGNVWAQVEGNNARVRMQSVAPPDTEFGDMR